MNKRVEKALNEQVNYEMFSGYLYLSMSAYFDARNLKGFSHWLRTQYQEEMSHAMLIFDFIQARGGHVELKQIDTPKAEWADAIDVFKDVVAHEEKITQLINDIVHLGYEEKDYGSVNFLQVLVEEQVEEESSVNDVLEQLRLIDGKGTGMFMMDKEMLKRQFVPIQAGK